jgi:hypothetical protein
MLSCSVAFPLLPCISLYRNDFPSWAGVPSNLVRNLQASTDERKRAAEEDDDGMDEENEKKPISFHLLLLVTKKYFQRSLFCETVRMCLSFS